MKKKTKLEIQLRNEITELVLENQRLKTNYKLMKTRKERYENLYYSYYGMVKSLSRTNDNLMILIPIGIILALMMVIATIIGLMG